MSLCVVGFGCETHRENTDSVISTVKTIPTKRGPIPSNHETEYKAKVARLLGIAWYSLDCVSWKPILVGNALKLGTYIKTDDNSMVFLYLRQNGPIVCLAPSSILLLKRLSYNDERDEMIISTELDLQEGKLLGIVKKLSSGSKYEISTQKEIQMQVTEAEYELSADGMISVFNGAVIVTSRSLNKESELYTIKAGGGFCPSTSDHCAYLTNVSDIAKSNAKPILDEMKIYVNPTP